MVTRLHLTAPEIRSAMEIEFRALTPQEMKDWLAAQEAPKQWLKELIAMTPQEEQTK